MNYIKIISKIKIGNSLNTHYLLLVNYVKDMKCVTRYGKKLLLLSQRFGFKSVSFKFKNQVHYYPLAHSKKMV